MCERGQGWQPLCHGQEVTGQEVNSHGLYHQVGLKLASRWSGGRLMA